MSIKISIKSSDLNHTFQKIMKISGGISKHKMINIRAENEYVELSIQGISLKSKAEVIGEGDIIMPSRLLKQYIDSSSNAIITFNFEKGKVRFGSSIYETSAIDIFPLGLRPYLEMPINPSCLSVLKYAFSEKNEKEVQMKRLITTVKCAKIEMKNNVQAAYEILKKYQVTHDDIEKIVINKILNSK